MCRVDLKADRVQSRRFLLACLSIFQPAGVIICSALAFAFIPSYSCSPNFAEPTALQSCRTSAPGETCCSRSDNMGWRYLLFTLGALTLFVFFMRTLIFTCQETPKFLIYRGQDAKAIQTMAYVAKTNNTQCGLTLDVFDFLQSQHDYEQVRSELSPLYTDKRKVSPANYNKRLRHWLGRFKVLFNSTHMTALTILTWLTYILDFGGFTIAGMCLLFDISLSCLDLHAVSQASSSHASWPSKTAQPPSASSTPTPRIYTATPPASSPCCSAPLPRECPPLGKSGQWSSRRP